jgi:hypothetical protein
MKHTTLAGLLLPVISLLATPGFADSQSAPTIEELWQIIQEQQAEIEKLKQQQSETAQTAADADEKAEAAVVAVEESGTATGGKASWAEKTSIGGYGELHYNNIDADDSSRDDDQIDLHRFVLFFGHEFTDRLRFFSEVEYEHALTKDNNGCDFTVPPGGLAPGDTVSCSGDEGPGEVEIEQAYIEYDITDQLSTKGGVYILPVGILNETHEPTTFYGVERNDVENIIIPSTWWAGGAALSGHHANGISWDIGIHEGLKMNPDTLRVRSGRQKTAEADANDLAYTGRLKYTGIPGLELAASINYQTDASQEGGDGLGRGILYETHAIYQNGPFALRALYAEWDFDVNRSVSAASSGADEQSGWYIEPSYKPWEKLGLYTRYEDLEGARGRDQFNQWEVGLNYWPHEDVVLKADLRRRDHDLSAESGRDFDAFDLGIGYQF